MGFKCDSCDRNLTRLHHLNLHKQKWSKTITSEVSRADGASQQFGCAINHNDIIESAQALTIAHLHPKVKLGRHKNLLSLKGNCWNVQFSTDKSVCDNKWCSMLWLTKIKNIATYHTTRAQLLSCITFNYWTTWYWTIERINGYCIELDL